MAAGDWRESVFKNRGAILTLPAVALLALGRPTRASVTLGVPIALAGEALRCWAVGYSGVTTRAGTVTAPALVTAGPYAHVRNPLYLGNFVTALGFSIAFTGGLSGRERVGTIALALGSMLGVYAAIVPLEEAYLRETFGSDFEAYAERVPRLVPRLRPAASRHGRYDPSVIVAAETRTFLSFGLMLAGLLLKTRRGGA